MARRGEPLPADGISEQRHRRAQSDSGDPNPPVHRDRADLAERAAELADRDARIADEWATAWHATGLAAVLPRRRCGWLDQRDAILDLQLAAEQAQIKARALDARVRAQIDAIATILRGLGHEMESDDGFETVASRPHAVVDEARQLAAARASVVRP